MIEDDGKDRLKHTPFICVDIFIFCWPQLPVGRSPSPVILKGPTCQGHGAAAPWRIG